MQLISLISFLTYILSAAIQTPILYNISLLNFRFSSFWIIKKH